jgi:hypothetical protein
MKRCEQAFIRALRGAEQSTRNSAAAMRCAELIDNHDDELLRQS